MFFANLRKGIKYVELFGNRQRRRVPFTQGYMSTNCCRIVGDSAIRGFHWHNQADGNYYVGPRPVGLETSGTLLRVRFSTPPRDETSKIFVAAPSRHEGRVCLECPGLYTGYIVYFDTGELNFADPTFVAGLHLWAGMEWHNEREIWRRVRNPRAGIPDWKQPERGEVWGVPFGEKRFMVDRQSRIRLFIADPSEPVLRVPLPRELALYLLQRARALAQNPRGLEWVFRNLTTLRSAFPSNTDVRECHEGVSALKQTTPVLT